VKIWHEQEQQLFVISSMYLSDVEGDVEGNIFRAHLFMFLCFSGSEFHVKNMEYDLVPHKRQNILTSSLCDFTTSVDYQDDTHQQTSMSNQDTGYQTASLQTTNPESVSLHTNLTNQFGAMPLNSTNQDSVFQMSSHLSASHEKSPVFNLTHHIAMIASQTHSDDEGERFKITEDFDDQMFPKQKLLFDDDEEWDAQETPKHKVTTKPKFDDSALPDDISSEHGQMEVDSRLEDIDCVRSQEKIVLGRARQALAMANTLYPQDGGTSVASTAFNTDTNKMGIQIPSIAPKDKKCTASEYIAIVIQNSR